MGLARAYAPGQHDFDVRRFRFGRNRLTGSRERFKRLRRLLRERPELALGGVTWGWLDASFRSMLLLRSPGFAEAIGLPVTVCVAGDELIVSNPHMEAFARRLPQGRLLHFPGARHELLQEVDAIRGPVLATVDQQLAALRG
jgi:lysophospholipase